MSVAFQISLDCRYYFTNFLLENIKYSIASITIKFDENPIFITINDNSVVA